MRTKKREIENLIEYPLPEMVLEDRIWWMWAIKSFPKWKKQFSFKVVK